jgi:hypothetical protein
MCLFAVLVGTSWIGSTPVEAQGLADRSDRPELRGGLDTKASSDKSTDKDITIGLEIPARYSSSVTSTSVDSVIEDRPDAHVTPEAYIKWAHQYDWFKVSAEFGASIDRYFKTSDANLDNVHTTFKFAKTNGKFEYFVPYFSLSNEMFFLPAFRQPDISYYDVIAGFYSGVAWRDQTLIPYRDSLIPFSDAQEPGDVAILFDARVGRRMSDTTDYQNLFVQGRVTATYFISNAWRVESYMSMRARWYEDYHGERRSDLRPSASIAIYWSPDWLQQLVKRSEFSLNLEYYRNYSNIPDKSYSLWEIGPTLSLRTKI